MNLRADPAPSIASKWPAPGARCWQSVVSPVISTSLYFVVFGAAIGSRITEIDGVSYGAFIVPGLIMLSLLTQSDLECVLRRSISRSSSARSTRCCRHRSPISRSCWLCRRGGHQIDHPGPDHPGDCRPVRAAADRASRSGCWFLVLTAFTFSCFGFIIGIWADSFREAADRAAADHHAADVPGRQLLLDQHAAATLAEDFAGQPGASILSSGFRWSFYEHSDVGVGISLAMTLAFLAVCLAIVSWMFRTGYRLKT